jgi:putative zinc finger/helix-turn-helix YgiT family protein
MKETRIYCPHGHREMTVKKSEKKLSFRDAELSVPVEQFVCSECGEEAGTIEQTAAIQKSIADTYRKSVGLLTGKEIVEGRKRLNLTQDDLAKKMSVGIASIKRWEGAGIQSKSMDQALRLALRGKDVGDTCTGNRDFSIPRIKLVLLQLETILGRKLLKKNDKMLFAAKYLWYADMIAHRETGQSMTGATYAALPLGPQLNNYRELLEDIMNEDPSSAEPLSPEEKRIISRVALKFPREQLVFKATHGEPAWKKKSNGQLIPYTDSSELTAL